MTESLNYLFTSEAEMRRIMSVRSVTDYASDGDVSDVEDTNLADIIAQATDEINFYCLRFYTEALLSENSYIRRLATWIACYHLSQRRGEPERYVGEYNNAIDQLKQVQQGSAQIPRIPWRSDFAPSHSNIVIDDRYGKARGRTQVETSSGGTYSGQNQDTVFNPPSP